MAYILLMGEQEKIASSSANSLLKHDSPYTQSFPSRAYIRNEAVGTLQHILMNSSDPDDLRNVLHDTLELLRTA